MRLRLPFGATPLAPDELAGLLPTAIATQEELDAFEQANISTAERWVMARRRTTTIDESFVRGLHRRMFDQVWSWAGRFRTSNKNLGDPWPHIATKVRALCDDARYGNGRHARLLTDVLLHNHGQTIFTWGSRAGEPMADVRARYIAALRAADARDAGPLIGFVRS